MGFFDDLGDTFAMQAMIEASKNKKGKPDPWAAAGMAAGFGLDPSQFATLGAMLGAQGAFDEDEDEDDGENDDENDDEDDEY